MVRNEAEIAQNEAQTEAATAVAVAVPAVVAAEVVVAAVPAAEAVVASAAVDTAAGATKQSVCGAGALAPADSAIQGNDAKAATKIAAFSFPRNRGVPPTEVRSARDRVKIVGVAPVYVTNP